MSLDVEPVFHVAQRGKHTDGCATCGRPAKQENIVPWGDPRINCDPCVRAYAAVANLGRKPS